MELSGSGTWTKPVCTEFFFCTIYASVFLGFAPSSTKVRSLKKVLNANFFYLFCSPKFTWFTPVLFKIYTEFTCEKKNPGKIPSFEQR